MIHVLHAGHGAGAHGHHLHVPAHGHHAVHPLHVLEIIQLGKGTQGQLLPMSQPQGGRPGGILRRRLELESPSCFRHGQDHIVGL